MNARDLLALDLICRAGPVISSRVRLVNTAGQMRAPDRGLRCPALFPSSGPEERSLWQTRSEDCCVLELRKSWRRGLERQGTRCAYRVQLPACTLQGNRPRALDRKGFGGRSAGVESRKSEKRKQKKAAESAEADMLLVQDL